MLNSENCLLLVIDIQEKLLNAVFNKSILEKNSRILKLSADILKIPVIITEQYPKGLGSTIEDIKNTNIYEKTSFNALEVKELTEYISSTNRNQIILIGIETHICVYQTALALHNLGYNVVLAQNACGSRTEFEHLAAIDVMKSNNIEIKTTEMILFELLKSSKHPNFKEIQALIK